MASLAQLPRRKVTQLRTISLHTDTSQWIYLTNPLIGFCVGGKVVVNGLSSENVSPCKQHFSSQGLQ